MDDVTARIEGLEVRVAHQEKIISELNDVITAQWRKLEGLERQLGRLSEVIEQLDQPPSGQERPPHY